MKKIIGVVFTCVCMLCFFSCSDDNNPVGDGGKEGSGETLKPEEHKAKLDQMGVKMLTKINPADHKNLLEVVDAFCELADRGDLSVEENQMAKAVTKDIRTVCAKSNLGKLLAFTDPESDLYAASDYYGIYTYQGGRWVRTDSDSKLEFRFSKDSKEAILSMVCTGSAINMTLDDFTQVVIPEKATATLTWGGTELCKLLVTSNSVNNTLRTANVNVNLSASGYDFEAKVTATKEKATCDFTMKNKGEVLLTATAYVNGKGLTNAYDDDETVENRFTDAYSKVYIMNDANVIASCSNIKEMVAKLDELDSKYNSYNEDEEERYEKACAEVINKYMKCEFRYSDSGNPVATLGVQAYSDPYTWTDYDGKEHTEYYWDLETIITFASDNTPYSLESYFDDEVSFEDLINSYEKLADQYESYLKYLN